MGFYLRVLLGLLVVVSVSSLTAASPPIVDVYQLEPSYYLKNLKSSTVRIHPDIETKRFNPSERDSLFKQSKIVPELVGDQLERDLLVDRMGYWTIN